MKLGDMSIGSDILIDTTKAGNKFITTNVIGCLGDTTVLVGDCSEDVGIGCRDVIVEVTNMADKHVYRFVKCTLNTSRDSMITSTEDSDYKTTRQERRFRYHTKCIATCGSFILHESSINDVSLSGISVVIPEMFRRNIKIGDELKIKFRYIDGSQIELNATIVREQPYDNSKLLYGCIVTQGKESMQRIITKRK